MNGSDITGEDINLTTQEMIGGQYSRGQRTGSEKNGTVCLIDWRGIQGTGPKMSGS